MKIIKANEVIYFDVDDTLIFHLSSYENHPDCLEVQIEGYSIKERIRPHKKHIEALKAHKKKGDAIVVWSQGGWEWANAVVLALNLEKYVDLIISKPTWIYDDLSPNEFLMRIWQEDK